MISVTNGCRQSKISGEFLKPFSQLSALKSKLVSFLCLGTALLCAGRAGAVPVIKIDSNQTMIAIPHGAKRKWVEGEYLCVQRGGKDVACGPVKKTTRKGALVKFDYQTGDEIAEGDEVVFKRSPAMPNPNPPNAAPPGRFSGGGGGPSFSSDLPVDAGRAARAGKALPEGSVEADLQQLDENAPPKPDSSERARREALVETPPEDAAEEPPKSEPRRRRPKPAEPAEEAEVNLDEESPAATTAATVSNPHSGGLGKKPAFRAMFDWWLTYQPGRDPNGVSVTFDNLHYLMILEIVPDPRFYFGFEVSTAPRFFELDYQVTRSLTLRLGRIYIPFDDLSPHSYFGGRVNVTRLGQPGSSNAFLPDIWTDLGIGARLSLGPKRSTHFDLDGYVVNGFSENATFSPSGDTAYPDFSQTLVIDNNNNKSLGGRMQVVFGGDLVTLGGSAFYGRYSADTSPSASILMAGTDAKLHFEGTEIRVGYIYMNVGVIPTDSFVRGGFYLELSQWFGNLRALARMGQSQNDSRVVQNTDQTIVGGSLAYRAGPVQLSLELSKDINEVPGKNYTTFAGFRVGVML